MASNFKLRHYLTRNGGRARIRAGPALGLRRLRQRCLGAAATPGAALAQAGALDEQPNRARRGEPVNTHSSVRVRM